MRDDIANKSKALTPMIGKWKMESKQSGQMFYANCGYELDNALVTCQEYADSEMTEKTGHRVVGYDASKGHYYSHGYNQYGFIPLDMHINGDEWTIQGKTPSTEGVGFMRVVRTFIDQNTSDVVTEFSVAGREFETIQELTMQRIQ